MSKVPPPPDFNKVLSALRRSMGGFSKLGALPFVIGFTGIASWTLYNGIYFVQGGHRAVKFNAFFGMYDQTYGEGANLCIPYVETPIVFDIRSKPTEVITSSGSKDLQIVNMAVRVLYQPNPDQLHTIYRELGINYPETVLPSVINEIIKAVIAQFNASDLLTRRPEVSSRIAVLLQERARQFNIEITDVSITQMSFGKEYTNAVEAKQIAQQMAERAKFQVEQARQEKRSTIVLAEGEAQAARLIGKAVQFNPAFVELRKLEAARNISRIIKASKGRYFLDSEGLMIDVVKDKPIIQLAK